MIIDIKCSFRNVRISNILSVDAEEGNYFVYHTFETMLEFPSTFRSKNSIFFTFGLL